MTDLDEVMAAVDAYMQVQSPDVDGGPATDVPGRRKAVEQAVVRYADAERARADAAESLLEGLGERLVDHKMRADRLAAALRMFVDENDCVADGEFCLEHDTILPCGIAEARAALAESPTTEAEAGRDA